MALYLISYDLLNTKTFGDCEELIKGLRRMGAQESASVASTRFASGRVKKSQNMVARLF